MFQPVVSSAVKETEVFDASSDVSNAQQCIDVCLNAQVMQCSALKYAEICKEVRNDKNVAVFKVDQVHDVV